MFLVSLIAEIHLVGCERAHLSIPETWNQSNRVPLGWALVPWPDGKSCLKCAEPNSAGKKAPLFYIESILEPKGIFRYIVIKRGKRVGLRVYHILSVVYHILCNV